MRKFQQKQLLEIINTIKEANTLIERFVKKQNYDEAIKLLVDCQEGAISVGNRIEQLEGEGTISVAYLEEYCDMIYQTGMEINEGKELKKSIVLLHNQIIKIENSIISDIKADKLEVVFLPYNASMWDSLESVWMAARDDENCEAYVVPIPYFEKNPDGSFGQMYYEGDKYPDYVPITSWQEYSIPERKPDVIYIHNPYDQYNHVTSVQPTFYSTELKKHTDMLVYIPYFVGVNDSVPEHLCAVAAVLHADRIIVESETIKEIYLNALKKFETQNNCQGKLGDWNKKIMPLGSPKLDRVGAVSEVKIEIPEEWKEKIYKNDGSKRIVVFYNTTINVLLKYSFTYLTKLEEVINAFSGCNEFVLLWRPHPLLESTLKSMRPDLHARYRNILKEFIANDKGILDDAADFDRAIVLSDMYYGDGSSSISTLYKTTGKPMFFQNAETKGLGLNRNPFLIGLCEYNGDFYGVDYAANILLRFDQRDKKIHYQTLIPTTKYDGNQPYQSYHYIYHEDERLYLIPFRENQIVIWDMEEDAWEVIPLSITERCTDNEPGNFYGCVKYGDILYLLPFGYKKILACNLVTKEQWFSFDFSETILMHDKALFYPYEYLDDSTIVMTCFYSNHIVIMDLITGDCRIEEVGDKGYRFSAIKKINPGYVIVVKNKLSLLFWDPKTSEVKEIKAFPQKAILHNDRHCFDGETVHIFDKYMYCFPASCNMAIRVDIETFEITEVEGIRPLCIDTRLNHEISTFDGCVRVENKLYLHYQLDKIVCFDMETEEVSEYDRELVSSPEEVRMMNKMLLDMFIDNVIKTPKVKIEAEESKGEVIHGAVSKSLL